MHWIIKLSSCKALIIPCITYDLKDYLFWSFLTATDFGSILLLVQIIHYNVNIIDIFL